MPPVIQNGTSAGDLFNRAVVISVSLSRPGNRRKVGNNAVETTADKSFIHVSKTLLNSPELKAIEKHDGGIRRMLMTLGTPAPWLKGGYYLIGNDLVPVVDRKLEDFQRVRDQLKAAAVRVYPLRKDEAKIALGPDIYNETDYPPVGVFEGAFGMVVRYQNFGVPEGLERISPEIHERETQRQMAEITEGMGEIRQALRRDFLDLVEHVIDRLGLNSDGTARTFKNTLVSNMTGFVETFPARNLAGDSPLAIFVDRARQALDGVTADKLRDNPSVRAFTLGQMQSIATELSPMVDRQASRLVEAA